MLPEASACPLRARSAGQRRELTVTPGQPDTPPDLRSGRLTRGPNAKASLPRGLPPPGPPAPMGFGRPRCFTPLPAYAASAFLGRAALRASALR